MSPKCLHPNHYTVPMASQCAYNLPITYFKLLSSSICFWPGFNPATLKLQRPYLLELNTIVHHVSCPQLAITFLQFNFFLCLWHFQHFLCALGCISVVRRTTNHILTTLYNSVQLKSELTIHFKCLQNFMENNNTRRLVTPHPLM